MMTTRIVTTSLLLISLLTYAAGQERVYDFKAFGVNNGLPHRNVKAICYDQDGLIWAATAYELTRFDGKFAKVYDRKLLGKAVNNIDKIAQDEAGYLWLWGQSGLFIFDPDEEVVQPVTENKHRSGLDKWPPPRFPLKADNGTLLFNPLDKAIICRGRTGKIVEQKQLDLPEPFNLLAPGPNHLFWVHSGGNLLLITSAGEIEMELPIKEFGQVELARRVGTDRLLIFTKNRKEGELPRLLLINDRGEVKDLTPGVEFGPIDRVFYEAQQSIIWLEMENNWELRDLNGGVVTKIFDDEQGKEFIYNSAHSWDHTVDEAGNIWLATEHGINRISSKISLFNSYLDHRVETDRGRGYSIRGIWADQEYLMVAAELDGVFFKRKEDTTFSKIGEAYLRFAEGRGLPKVYDFAYKSDYRALFRESVSDDSAGKFWLGHQRVVLSYDAEKNEYKSYPPAFSYNVDLGVNSWSFHQTKGGDLLVGTQPGLKYIAQNGDSLRAFAAPPPFTSLNKAAIYQFLDGPNNTTLMVTSEGLFTLDTAGILLAHYHARGNGRYNLPFDNLYGGSPAENGQYWLATNGDGLVLYDLEEGIIGHWTQREGLVNDVIYAVYEDEFGALWLPSDKGLMRMDTTCSLVHTFTTGDGLPANEFNRIAHFRDSDGDLYLGTIRGLVAFSPADFTNLSDRVSPDVQILELRKKESGTQELTRHTAALRIDSTIVITPNDEYFHLTVALPAYTDQKIYYDYRLDGEKWVSMVGNELQLGRFDFGEHQLSIRGKVAGGGFSPKPLVLRLLVRKPYYLTPGFFLGLFFTACILIYLLVQFKTQRLLSRQETLERKIKAATAQLEKDKNLIKAQADELAEVDRMKTRLFANISHELRTPLTLIMGPLRSLRGRNVLAESDQHFLALAEDNSRELLQTINSILDLAKLDNKGMTSNPVPTDLSALCQQCVMKFEQRANDKGVKLSFDPGNVPDNASFLLDGDKVSTILSNLLANALRFTPTGGKVKLSAASAAKELILRVEDTGLGIRREDVNLIFDRFYQVREAGNKTGNSGIGLSLSKELSVLMGGDISVSSKIGEGSVFRVVLPAKQLSNSLPAQSHQAAHHLDQPEPIAPLANSDTHPGLLIVEDHPGMQHYLRSILGDLYQVNLADDGVQALDWMEKAETLPELIITDLMMPKLDGFELINRIKQHQAWRGIPIIVLSAKDSVKDRVTVLRYGIDDYLAKPFDELELLVRIKRLLENAKERENTQLNNPVTQEELAPDWLLEIEQFVIDHLADNRLSATFLADAFHVSLRQLQRRLKAQTGLPPGGYIKEIRLNEAARLLETRSYNTIKVVAGRVGFRNAEYFSTVFKNRFGKPPSDYLLN